MLASYLVGHPGSGQTNLCWDLAWTLAALGAVIGTWMARQAAVPSLRRSWTLWSAAAACWLVGQLAWDVFGIVGTPASPNPADFGWWGFAILVIVSLLPRRTASRSLRAVAAAETLPVVGAVLALTFSGLWPDIVHSTLGTGPRISAVVYPVLYLTAGVLMLQAMLGACSPAPAPAPCT